MLLSQGKYGEAERLFRQALGQRERLLGKAHPEVAASLNDLAGVLLYQGKYGEAELLYRQALALRKNRLGEEHPEVAISLTNVAVVLSNQGKYGEAERLYREALAMRQKLLGKEHPEDATSLSDLAGVLFRQGKYGEAERLLREALAMRQKLLGKEHPDIAASLFFLALAQQQIKAALPLLGQSLLIRESQLRSAVSETRVQALLQTLRIEEDAVYGLLLTHWLTPETKCLALQTSLLRKGRAAQAGAAANRLLHASKSSPELNGLFTRWQSLRQQREALLYSGPGSLPPAAYQARLQELINAADTLEYQLADRLPELRLLHPPTPEVIIAEVAKQLPINGVLMEVLWVRAYQPWVKDTPPELGKPHYVALLLFPDQRIEAQDLGEAAVIESESRALVSALASPRSKPLGPAGALYKRVLAPMLPQLRGVQHLYLSLDGVLNLVHFDALHDGKDYLLGRYHLP